jgi:hypothetical protein
MGLNTHDDELYSTTFFNPFELFLFVFGLAEEIMFEIVAILEQGVI